MPTLGPVARIAAYAWAAPNSALGLLVGVGACLGGARARVHRGVLEIAGGRLGRRVADLPPHCGFCALTLGHVVLATDAATLRAVRRHEQAHVRQYERWGPFFLPAYLLSSLFQLLLGRRPYIDNAFERQARLEASAHVRRTAGWSAR